LRQNDAGFCVSHLFATAWIFFEMGLFGKKVFFNYGWTPMNVGFLKR
jgi:hypothetical protein